MFDAPVGQRPVFLLKHTFTAAGSVDQHFVHPAAKLRTQPFRGSMGYHRFADAQAFQIAHQDARPAAVNFIRDQKTGLTDPRRDLCTFPARRRA